MNKNITKITKKVNNSKTLLIGIIFARAFCSIGIIIYHYFCHSKGKFKFLFTTANSNFGFMFVTSFYSISGNVLYYNYPKVNSLKTFYYKRWNSIFPSYYICFIFFFIQKVFKYHKFFYNGHWTRLIFTIFGMDGFLQFRYGFKTYYLVGEWFLGSIIILYILYPIFSLLMNKNILIVHFIACAFYPIIFLKNATIFLKKTNIIVSIYSFYFGMLSSKLHILFFKNKIILIISTVIFIFLCLIKISDLILIFQIQGFSIFLLLVRIGELLMLTRFKIIFIEISTLSYNIFLFQHIIILDILHVNNPKEWYKHLLLLSITIILTILCSKVLFIVVNNVKKSFFFKKIELLFIKT